MGQVELGGSLQSLAGFFERLYRIAVVDGVVTREEEDLLAAVAACLEVTPEEFDAMRMRIRAPEGLAGEDGLRLAKALVREGELEEAEAAFKTYIGALRELVGPDHPCLVQPLLDYAALLEATDRKDLAEAFEARARELQARF